MTRTGAETTWGVILMNNGGKIMKLKCFTIVFLGLLILQVDISYCAEKELNSEIFIQGSIDRDGKINSDFETAKIGSYTNNEKYKLYLSFNLAKIPQGSVINSATLVFNYNVTNKGGGESLDVVIKNIDYGLYLDKKDYDAVNLSSNPVNYSLSTAGTNCSIDVSGLVKDAFVNVKPWMINESRYFAQFSIEVLNDDGCINIDILKEQIVLRLNYN